MLEFLGGSLDTWIVAYFILFGAFIYSACYILRLINIMKKLQKNGTLITRKGTYTFTSHKELNKHGSS
jgi:hypothetical protein